MGEMCACVKKNLNLISSLSTCSQIVFSKLNSIYHHSKIDCDLQNLIVRMPSSHPTLQPHWHIDWGRGFPINTRLVSVLANRNVVNASILFLSNLKSSFKKYDSLWSFAWISKKWQNFLWNNYGINYIYYL